jgi:hypothetical protein
MTDERRQRILDIAQELEDQGLEATNSAVYSRALGHRGDVVQVMKARRAERGGSDVAVLEEPDDDPEDATQTPAAVLAEDLRQLESTYEGWHLALEHLWQQEQDGPLDLAAFSRKSWLEYQLTANFQAQERLRPQLEQARTREAVRAAQAQHDALIPEVTAQAEAVIDALATLTEALAALRQGFGAQSDPFFPFRSRDGHQAFDVADGDTYTVQFLQLCFPGDYRAKELVDLLRVNPVTVGRATDALQSSARLQPFPERVISRYLEGVSHASHA